MPAEFHLVSQSCGTAELKLTFPLCAPSDPIPPSTSTPAASLWGTECLKKASPSRVLRRERRAAERAAAMRETAVKAAGEEVATEEVAHEKVAAEESATVKVSGGEAAAKLEKVAKVKTAAENSDPEKDAAANDELNVDVATTSCAANLTCDAGKNADHQYVAPHIPPSTAAPHVVAQKHSPAPLPLCHYCCHR